MDTTRPKQGDDWREWRRFQAWELHQKGWKQKTIAEALGVSKGAVSQWLARVREEGVDGLRHRKPPGAPSRLTAEQKARLPDLRRQGAEAFGLPGDVWTARRVAALIKSEFNVSYHPNHVTRLLRALGWSPQIPVHRATQRNEKAIQGWKEERWPTLKKKR